MKTRKILRAPMIQADADRDWELAQSIQVTPSDVALEPHTGVLIAKAHATGWFVSARARKGLHASEKDGFKRLVAHRVYLLLQEGPAPQVWTHGETDGEWRCYATIDADPFAGPVPETVPADWR